MAYARPFGQPQGASPWSSGVPPGLQQQHQQQAQQVQPMFNQPMGAFDISGAWQQQGQPQQQATQQWAPVQQVQFVPNPAYMQPQPPPQQQMRHQPMQQQQQRPMHQRSLSAPRIGVNVPNKRGINQNNSFGGPQQQQQHWNNRQQQQQNNQNQQRMTRQQSRLNNQSNNNNNPKGQFNNNNNNNNNNTNHKNLNKQQSQQQSQQQRQQSSKQGLRNTKGQAVKVTKVKKQVALKAKHGNKVGGNVNKNNHNNAVKVEKAATSSTDDATSSTTVANASPAQPKAQSKTAERKQLKLQARKNAEALKQSKLPVAAKANGASSNGTDSANKSASADDQKAAGEQKADEPIDQAQLKCVPAVFGFVCKLCDVFLRDKAARREHIDSDDHMEKFKNFEEAEKVIQQQQNAETTKEDGKEADETEVESKADEVKEELKQSE